MINNQDEDQQGKPSSTKSITREDLTRAAGVSATTVSYVINKGPRPVSSKTRERILDAIVSLGYHPNKVAQNLRRQQSSMIGLIIPDTANMYFAEVSQGVEQVAFENDFTVLLCHSNYDIHREMKYVEILLAEQCAGVLWVPASMNKDAGERLIEYGTPFIILDRIPDGLDAPRVIVDNYRGGFLMTNYLLSLGHRRIGFISRPQMSHHSNERLNGYLAALKDAKIEVDNSIIEPAQTFHLDGGRQAAKTLLSHPEPPSAIFAYSDVMAIGVLRGAYELGLRVPNDLSVAGFDDTEQAAFTCPALTTIKQPKLEMGRMGSKLLLDLIKGTSQGDISPNPLGVELVIRESTTAPKGITKENPGIYEGSHTVK